MEPALPERHGWASPMPLQDTGCRAGRDGSAHAFLHVGLHQFFFHLGPPPCMVATACAGPALAGRTCEPGATPTSNQRKQGSMEDMMTDAPESMDGQVQERAYALWEQEGKPEGRAEEHWRQARSELGLETAGQGTEAAVSDSGPALPASRELAAA